jgi:hypothetical protein
MYRHGPGVSTDFCGLQHASQLAGHTLSLMEDL